MRRAFLFLLLLACGRAFAADVLRPGAAIYTTLEKGIIWNNLTNAYVLDAASPGTGVCLTFINNAASSFGFNLTSYTTASLAQTTFTGSTALWTQQTISPPAATSTPQYTVGATATLQVYIRIAGAAHYVLSFSSPTASASNTVTIFAVQTPSPCGSVNQWQANGNGAAGVAVNISIAGVAGVRHVVNTVSAGIVSGATAGINTITIRDTSNTASCTGTILWESIFGVSATAQTENQVAVSGLNLSGSAGNALQCCAGGAAAASTQYCSISGYDQ